MNRKIILVIGLTLLILLTTIPTTVIAEESDESNDDHTDNNLIFKINKIPNNGQSKGTQPIIIVYPR